MKTKNLNIHPSIYWLIHPAALAFYVFLILYFSMPSYFQKYHAEIIQSKELEDFQKEYYYDLDGNGTSESIYLSDNGNIPNVHYRSDRKILINQWNLKGKWLSKPSLYFGDYNHNKYSEVCCVTINNDSILLNISELIHKNGVQIESRFITTVEKKKNNETDVFDVDGRFFDVNGDGYDEYVFSIFGGFSLYPRNTFIYDLVADTLFSSPYSASSFRGNIQYMDLNNDGIPEITGDVYAAENVHDDRPLTDSSAWLAVLDSRNFLNYLFEPIEVGIGIGSSVVPCFYQIQNRKYIATSVYSANELRKSNSIYLQLYNEKGKQIKGKKINRKENDDFVFLNQVIQSLDGFILLKNSKQFYYSDTSLNFQFHSEIETGLEIYSQVALNIDLNGDGKDEIIFLAESNGPEKLIIYTPSLTDPCILDLPNQRRIVDWHFSLKKANPGDTPILVFQADHLVNFIKYNKSTYYFLKYPTYAIVYLLLFLIFWLLQKAQKSVISKRYETEKQLMQQQMALSKKQMEPHFMLNMINNIGYMFSKDNKQDAMFYLGKFGSLMRQGLINSQASQITLEEELEFVEDYLILQKKLMDDELEYSIQIEEIVEEELIQIPHSIVYTFVENAIKHGLKPKEKDRLLEIKVEQGNEQVRISIKDNGIGRQKSKEYGTTDTGKGMEIIKNIIMGYNQLHDGKISYDVENVLDENNKTIGTRVVIWV
jgi:hypothetical protein